MTQDRAPSSAHHRTSQVDSARGEQDWKERDVLVDGVGGWLDPLHDLVVVYGYEDCNDDDNGDRHVVPCASPEERSEFAGQGKERNEKKDTHRCTLCGQSCASSWLWT